MTEDQGDRSSRAATARAEELVDRLGESVGHLASLAGWRLLKVAALAREEAEDVWAEAQSLRHTQGAPRQAQDAEPAGVAETVAATDMARRTAEKLNVGLRGVIQSVERGMQSTRRQEQGAEPAGVAQTIQATDVARRVAEELNVDLREVRGTGVNGRITAGDVKRKKKEDTGSGPG